jgi:hypothetical protein
LGLTLAGNGLHGLSFCPAILLFFFLIEQTRCHFKAAPNAFPPYRIIRRRLCLDNHLGW